MILKKLEQFLKHNCIMQYLILSYLKTFKILNDSVSPTKNTYAVYQDYDTFFLWACVIS